MSEKDNPQYQGFPPEWAGQMPPQGYYGFPPMNPMGHPGGMHQAMPPEVAQYHAHMHAMAMQQAAHHQAMLAAQQNMMNSQHTMNPQSGVQGAAGNNEPQPSNPFENDPMLMQAQAMLEGAMGEEDAGIFKEILGSLGMSDKEFWKGALVGAAATLVLSNENVRKSIMGLVSGTGDMLKNGGASVKESATNTASSVKENVTASGEIFRDTYQAGKDGFKESVERHKSPSEPEVQETEEPDVIADPESNSGSNI